jgi:hypothetical protein
MHKFLNSLKGPPPAATDDGLPINRKQVLMTSTEHDTRDDLAVTLLPWEWKWCVDVANARMTISNEKELNHASTYRRDHLERITQEITGACGELAVAKFLGKYWSPSVNTFHSFPDIEPNIEVRSTVLTTGCLPVRDNDADDRYYFLAVGTPPTMTVVGYIRGSDAKRQQWLRDPNGYRPAYFVPQEALLQPRRRDES